MRCYRSNFSVSFHSSTKEGVESRCDAKLENWMWGEKRNNSGKKLNIQIVYRYENIIIIWNSKNFFFASHLYFVFCSFFLCFRISNSEFDTVEQYSVTKDTKKHTHTSHTPISHPDILYIQFWVSLHFFPLYSVRWNCTFHIVLSKKKFLVIVYALFLPYQRREKICWTINEKWNRSELMKKKK